jgi:predicted transglutaminase-like cysteine proteinase
MRHAFFARLDSRLRNATLSRTARCAGIATFGFLGLALVFGAPASAQTLAALPSTSQPLEKSGTAKPVPAWTKFCERQPAECAVDASEPASIALTPDLWRTIVGVNRRINARIKPMTDEAQWGIVDRWDFPDDGVGDCEDYQLLKRKTLVERGIPRRALRMTVVIDEQNEGHAVLMVRTDRGDFILDNKTSTVLPWEQTGYIFVKREGQDGLAWVSLNGVKSPTTTANR